MTAGSDIGSPGGRRWHAKAVLFQSRVRDLITFAAVCPDPSPQFAFGCASNVDRARIEGLSLSVGQDTRAPDARQDTSGFGWYLNLDFLDPRDVGHRNPPRAARGQAPADRRPGLRQRPAHGSARTWWSRAAVSTTRPTCNELGGYAVLNLRAGYRLSREWEGFATVINAGDRDYATALDYVQQGRLVMLGVRYRSR